MRNKLFAVASLLIIASMLLAACATPTPAQPGATPEVIVQTQVVEKTVVVTVEGETKIVTATPQPAATAAPIKSKDPTTYVAVTFGDPETLDPALDYETAGGSIVFNVYDTLVFYNKGNPGEFVPQLATEVPTVENGGMSADGTTLTFKIRQGVKFHDGSALTPSDVAYTFQRGMLQGGTASPQWMLLEPFLGVGKFPNGDITDLLDPDGALGLADAPAELAKVDAAKLEGLCKQVTDAIVADDAAGTVTMKLAQPWAPFMATIANNWGAIQSKAWVIKGGGWDGDCKTWQNFYGKTSDELSKTPLGTTAMGTGPFKLDHWTPTQEIVLTANEDYWRKEPAWEGGPTGAPKLKKVIIKNVNEFSTRLAMFQAGDSDTLQVGSSSDYPQADELVGLVCDQSPEKCEPSKSPDKQAMVIKNLPSISATHASFTFKLATEGGNNFVGSGKLDGNGIPADFFSDVNIRKGFAYCFNYDQYLKQVLLGEGVRAVDLMLPGMVGYNENDPHYTYDPAKCEESFKASTLKGEGGKSLWDLGFRMTIAYNTGNTQRQTIAQIFQQELAAVNDKFVIEVTGLPWPTFLKNQRALKLPIFVSGWLEDIQDTHNWLVPYTTGTYGGRQALPAELKAQFADIINRGVVETDQAKRAAIYADFNKLFYEQVPTILLFVGVGRRYQQRWVKGWYYNPIYSGTWFYPLSKE